jgi:nucleotide-binding universal stress UspA family protein
MTYTHVLAATDFSDTGNQAVQCAFEEAALHHATVTVLHVWRHHPDAQVYFFQGDPETRAGLRNALVAFPAGFDPATGNALPMTPSPERATIRDYDEEALAQMRDLAPATFPGKWHVRVASGDPARVIIHVAEEYNADLIVLGAHGHRGFAHAIHRVLGGVAEKVVRHASCAVLTIGHHAD